MSGIKNIVKGGWHPEGKNGGRESWRGEFKGINQVAGLVGRGKDTSSRPDASTHQSRPLSTLKDPATFGPPPRHVATTSGSPVSDYQPPTQYNEPTPSEAPSYDSRPPPVPQRASGSLPIAQSSPPGLPLRSDSAGSGMSTLPKPPVRRPGDPIPAPPPRMTESSAAIVPQQPKAKPSLPPRLPPRQDSRALSSTPSPPPTYNQALQQSPKSVPQANQGLNQGAIDRLGQAGISVPGLNIGGGGTAIPSYTSSDATVPAQSPTRPSRPQAVPGQVGELQQRFARMGLNQGSSVGESQSPSSAAAAKKAPPPPPKKKPFLANNESVDDGGKSPPPIPMGSKPSLG
ncbi:MAG: hypothetical protein M1821_009849 [Bathelium mastoideum]|nr:MAG: hypothetical protein M1821_009849 [Bathelium mastoideum]